MFDYIPQTDNVTLSVAKELSCSFLAKNENVDNLDGKIYYWDNFFHPSCFAPNSFFSKTSKSNIPIGKHVIILNKKRSFAEQVTQGNTIYIIRDNIQINDSKPFIMPPNCKLRFEGGHLKGSLGGTIEVDGEYDKHFDVYIPHDSLNTIITPNYRLYNYSNEISRSQLEACRNGIILCENINVSIGSTKQGADLYTSIKGINKKVTICANSKLYYGLNVRENNVTIQNVTLKKQIGTQLSTRLFVYSSKSDITINNCNIYGGFLFFRSDSASIKSQNIFIYKNNIYADFSTIEEKERWSVQKDVFTFRGYENVKLTNNYVEYKNVNRCIKTSYTKGQIPDKIDISDNIFKAECTRGYCMKQFWDGYIGTANIRFCNNSLDVLNHTCIIENKTQNVYDYYSSKVKAEISGNKGRISGGFVYSYNKGNLQEWDIHDNQIEILMPAGVDDSFNPHVPLYMASSKVSITNNTFKLGRNDLQNTSVIVCRLCKGDNNYHSCLIENNRFYGPYNSLGMRFDDIGDLIINNNSFESLNDDVFQYKVVRCGNVSIESFCNRGKGVLTVSGFAPKTLSINAPTIKKGRYLVQSPFVLNKFSCSSPFLKQRSSNDILSDQNKSSVNSLSVEVEEDGVRKYNGELYIFSRKRWSKINK